ncbi:MAG: hypothetical protein ABIJ56_20200 [Pseudomonadota bacterium]
MRKISEKHLKKAGVVPAGLILILCLMPARAMAADAEPGPFKLSLAGPTKSIPLSLSGDSEQAMKDSNKMVAAGWAAFGFLYMASTVEASIFAFASAFSEEPQSSFDNFRAVSGLVPLIGPFFNASIFLGYSHQSHEDRLFAALLILDGLFQMGAFATAIAGHVLHAKAKKKQDGKNGLASSKNGIFFTPLALPGAAGVGVSGYF